MIVQASNTVSDAKLRVFLFQLFCVLGQWQRAMTQLKVLAELNPETMMLARIFEPVLNCEVLRAEVFAGKAAKFSRASPAHRLPLSSRIND